VAREMTPDDPGYIPDDLVTKLEEERATLNPDQSREQQAREIFGLNVAAAAATITQVAMYGTTERIRLEASKYVVERILGKLGEDVGVSDPLKDFLTSVEKIANEGSSAGPGRNS
jgi:hypothetical protein